MNIQAVFAASVKANKKKKEKNKKACQNLGKITPKLADKLLTLEESQDEDPYKFFFFIEICNLACWITLFFFLIIYITHVYLFDHYNQFLLIWFIKLWPKKLIWIYKKWFLNKKWFLTKRALVLIMHETLVPMVLVSFLYLLFFKLTTAKKNYRKYFLITLLFLIILLFFIFFCDFMYIFLFKNIFLSLQLTIQDDSKYVIEALFIILEKFESWFFMVVKFYSFISYYSFHILLCFCNLLLTIAYIEWRHFYIAELFSESNLKILEKQAEYEESFDEIIKDNDDPFMSNR